MSATAAVVIVAGVIVFAIAAFVLVRFLKKRADEEAAAKAEQLAEAAKFPVGLGDVVTLERDQLRLQGGWLLVERGTAIIAVWQASSSRAILTFPAPHETIYRAQRVELNLPKAPPAVLDLEGETHARYRQLNVKVYPLGQAEKPPWSRAILVEYRNVDRQSFFGVTDGDTTFTWTVRRTEAQVEHTTKRTRRVKAAS